MTNTLNLSLTLKTVGFKLTKRSFPVFRLPAPIGAMAFPHTSARQKQPVYFIGSSHMSHNRNFHSTLNQVWYSDFRQNDFIDYPSVDYRPGRRYGSQFNQQVPKLLQLNRSPPTIIVISLGDNNLTHNDYREMMIQVLSSIRNVILRIATTSHSLVITGIQPRLNHSLQQTTYRGELNARIQSLIDISTHLLGMQHRLNFVPMETWFQLDSGLHRPFFNHDGTHLSSQGTQRFVKGLCNVALQAALVYQEALDGRPLLPPCPHPLPTINLPLNTLPRIIINIPNSSSSSSSQRQSRSTNSRRTPSSQTLPTRANRHSFPSSFTRSRTGVTASPRLVNIPTSGSINALDATTQTMPEGAGVFFENDQLTLRLGNNVRFSTSQVVIFDIVPPPLSPIPSLPQEPVETDPLAMHEDEAAVGETLPAGLNELGLLSPSFMINPFSVLTDDMLAELNSNSTLRIEQIEEAESNLDLATELINKDNDKENEKPDS